MTRFIAIAPAILLAPAMAAQTPDHSAHDRQQPAQQQTAPDHSQHQPQQPATGSHAAHDQQDQPQMDHSKMDHGGQAGEHAMGSAFGSYQMQRDASGTSWVPDASVHGGVHGAAGDWMLMGHTQLPAPIAPSARPLV